MKKTIDNLAKMYYNKYICLSEAEELLTLRQLSENTYKSRADKL